VNRVRLFFFPMIEYNPAGIGRVRMHPALVVSLSFAVLILFGTAALLLPMARNGTEIGWLDALFSATSASCVTGLIVVDTGTAWSSFGQTVILLLIQIGGLGIMTFSTFFAYLFAGKLSIRNRDLLESSFGDRLLAHPRRLLLAIIALTLVFESIGALVLTQRFAVQWPLGKAVYLGLFHAVSAFCNAGFCLFSNSLVQYQTDPVINITIMVLIVAGGLGFWVWYDLRFLIRGRRTSLHSRIVLTTTAALLVFGMFCLLVFEWGHSMRHLSPGGKLMASVFQSVTSRTAGFNTLEMASLANNSLLIILILMLIGASPGSCGGGIKTTTFAVIVAMIYSRFRDQRQVQLLNRGIPEAVLSRAIAITFMFLGMLILACLVLLVSEHPGGVHTLGRTLFLEVVFEAFSAMGTVGLSMGLTPELSDMGRMVIILLMYIGRVGPLTLALAVAGRRRFRVRLAEEDFWVG